MEEARAIGELSKSGWRPRRTMVYCAWDAEEPGLLGSTEWVETHAEELRQKALIYINTDGNGRGFLNAGGSHSLQTFFDQVARDVTDPQTGVTVFERDKARDLVSGKAEPTGFTLEALGSGSDYTPFIQHLGIASLNTGFSGENAGGEYHSIYDSYDHYIRFKDPGFAYGIALAKVCGRTSLRFAEAEQLPFDFGPLASILSTYLDEIIQLADAMRTQTEKDNRLIREGLYRIATDPLQTLVVPQAKEAVPYLNFAPLQNALEQLKSEVKAFETVHSLADSPEKLATLNQQLMQMERALSLEAGLPGRPWYKHMIYAPGFYTGYGVKTLPGVREAIQQRNWVLAQEQIGVLAGVLDRFRLRLAAMRK
jgi:N-acetylated-alpha-linked acidic dipeptidase